MARPKRKEGAPPTALQIRLAAAAEFAAHGFAGARLADIAKRVGLTRPSLLHHFATKEALYAAVVEDIFERLRAALLSGMCSSGAFLARLDRIVERFVALMDEDPVPAQLLVRELLDAKGPGERLMRENVAPLLDLVETFIRTHGKGVVPASTDVRAAVLDLVGAVTLWAVAGASRDVLWRGPRRRQRFVSLARQLLLFERTPAEPPPGSTT